MLRCTAELEARGLEARLCAQLHDEMVWEVEVSSLGQVAALIKDCMENMQFLDEGGKRLPRLPVHIVAGPTWGDMQPVHLP